VIVDVCLLAVKPVVFTLTAITLVCPDVIESTVGLRLSHAAGSLAVQLKVPPPVLVMLNVWAAGFALPSAAVNVRLAILGLVVGVGEVG
jgi:hypothetical protein